MKNACTALRLRPLYGIGGLASEWPLQVDEAAVVRFAENEVV